MENDSIHIWAGCDPIISAAIERLQDRWRPYSRASKRYPLARLLGEIIDPAISEYSKKLPRHYQPYILGLGSEDFSVGFGFRVHTHSYRGRLVGPISEIIRTCPVGADRVQRHLIKKFENTACDPDFVATLETLVELLWACSGKRARHVKMKGLNGHRRSQEFCRFCGKPSELAAFAASSNSLDIHPNLPGTARPITLQLSSTHCRYHRVKLPTGEWNPAYKAASRSVAKFDLELDRLTQQSTNYETPSANSGDSLIDEYIYRYVHRFGFRPGDKAELRNHARRIVDGKLSDHKKRILALQHQGLNQSEIAAKLNVHRQNISRDLASIPEKFRDISADAKHHLGIKEGFRTKIRDIEPRIMDWLDDPRIMDIMLNPNGKLWGTQRSRTPVNGGSIKIDLAKLIITTIAAETQIIACNADFLECELPGLLRLSAWFPPTVVRPSFVIRKMAHR